MSWAGAFLWLPPSPLTAIQRWRKRVKQKKKKRNEEGEREKEREKEHPRKCLCCDASSTGKWPQRRCEGESESGAWRHSALVVPAGQCKLFSLCIKEKEGGGDIETEVPHTAYPQPESFVYLSVWCSVKPTCLCLQLTFLWFFKLKYACHFMHWVGCGKCATVYKHAV